MKQFVKELQEKDAVNSIFLTREKSTQVGKNGKSYISLHLSDITGSVDARLWDNVEKWGQEFEAGDFVRVKGMVQIFQNRKQVVVHGIHRAAKDEYQLRDLLPAAPRDAQEMYADLVQIVEGLSDENIRKLSLTVIQDPEMKERLLVCPAAKTIHHAYIGGLLEHVLSICQVMNFLASHYKVLNRDLLIFGAIFHDIGKVWELSVDDGIRYTEQGRLVGHLVLASELIEKTSARILGFPDTLKNVLKHIVLSHHGKLEYGSPKRPKFLEAFVVAMIDDFDSKMNNLEQFMRNEKRETGEQWSRYNAAYERYFYLGLLPDEN